MRIGLIDDMFFSLQRRLLEDGDTLQVHVDGAKIPPEGANVTDIKVPKGRLPAGDNYLDLRDNELIICGTNGYHHAHYEVLRALANSDTTVLGYTNEVIQLELNREYAFEALRKFVSPALLRLPHAVDFDDVDDAIAHLMRSEVLTKSVVLKQTAASPQGVFANRTVVSHDHQSTVASYLRQQNAWFDEKGVGGVRIENFVAGQEICWGAWFNGARFVGPIYGCVEHKGAQNGDRGGVLTGEVGTVMRYFDWDEDGRIEQVFRAIEPLLAGKCCGMIDLNTILDDRENLNFVEFTCRFGRPTLEVQLALLDPQINLSAGLRLLNGHKGWGEADAFWNKNLSREWACGVSVFTYGYPTVEPLLAHVEEGKSASLTPTAYFKMPTSRGNNFECQPIFARYDAKLKLWTTQGYERQFVAVGRGPTIGDARVEAYAGLDGFKLLGHTWRDDIGANLEYLEHRLLTNEIV